MNLSGGTFAVGNGVGSAINNNSSATVNISGGQLEILSNKSWGAGAFYGRPTTVTLSGGLLAFYNSSAATTLGGTGAWGFNNGTSTFNLNGGTLSLPKFGGTGGNGVFNFNGGTLQMTASSSDFLNSAHSTANVKAGAQSSIPTATP